MKKYELVHFDELEPVQCPCGETRRAFINDPDKIASIHIVDIKKDAKKHYHKIMTEIYYIIEGQGFMELDDEILPVRKGSSIMIKPGCRHRAIGEMKVINIPVPAYISHDEYFN